MGKGSGSECRPAVTILGGDRPQHKMADAPAQYPTESQPSMEELEVELVNFPGEDRGLFFTQTPFVDDVVYYRYDKNWSAEAQTADDTIVETLLGAGATVAEHEVSFPQYHSQHQLQPGSRFELQLDNGRLFYVPHWSIGDEWGVEFNHTVNTEWTSADHERYKQKLFETTMKEAIHQNQFFMVENGKKGKAADWELHILSEEPELATAIARGMHTWDKKAFRPATHHEILQQGTEDRYQRLRGAYYYDSWIWSNPNSELRASKALVRHGPMQFQFRSVRKKISPHDEAFRAAVRDAVIARMVASCGYQDSDIADVISARTTSTQYQRVRGRLTIPHQAPYSERGRLVVKGYTPAEATEQLQQLGLVGATVEQVPYSLLYGQRPHRRGRITPIHPDFISGAQLQLDGKIPNHGLTGIESYGNEADAPRIATERLESIIRSGGLRSIAERRRMGVHVNSLSPIGDIASGIDEGVSSSITSEPVYGGISFIFKPEVLLRRDVWFSDQDFGGGKNRYERYTQYAKQIGQEGIHTPPNARTRQRHLNTGLKEEDNECYLKHGVWLHEIDTILIDKQYAPAVTAMLRGVAADGIQLPQIRFCQPEHWGEDEESHWFQQQTPERQAELRRDERYPRPEDVFAERIAAHRGSIKLRS